MAAKAGKSKSIGRATIVVGQDQGPVIYTDRIEIGVQFYDLKLKLQQILRNEGDEVIVKEAATIVLSPPHAKALVLLLGKSVESYEEAFGAITAKPGMTIEGE